MKQILYVAGALIIAASCNSQNTTTHIPNENKSGQTMSYPYVAIYSSDITVPSHPENAMIVLHIWKMFETMQFSEMKKYYADTVTYDAFGHRFHGSSEQLRAYAQKDVESLDSLRFDISTWQSLHINDKNEDWVYIWAAERRYGKDGKADTTLIHEQWKIENGKVTYFNLYSAKPVI